jgi:UDP-N-acetylglucosamine acyltransferase
VQVGAYAVVGAKVSVGAGTVIGPHVVLDGWTQIGDRNQIFPGAAIGLEPQDMKYGGADTGVVIGNDNCIREYVTIHRATHEGEVTAIGNHNLLMAYSHIAHNCLIEDQVIITNSVALAGHIHIESYARIGGVVGVHQFVHIGRYSMVGGMSRVDRDVPPYMLVEGNPSRVRSLNAVGLKRAGLADTENGNAYQLLRKAFRLLYRSGLTLNGAIDQMNLLPENEHIRHLQNFLQQTQQPGRRGVIPAKLRGISTDD